MDAKSSADAGPIQVEVQIDAAFAGLLSEGSLARLAESVLRSEGVTGEVTLVITDDPTIHGLNRDFLGQDTPTDVLAFSSREEGESFVSAPEVGSYLGDVVVSYPRAVVQAGEAGHAPEWEVSLLVVHGILHLLGYDHAGEEDKAAMWARQEALLAHN